MQSSSRRPNGYPENKGHASFKAQTCADIRTDVEIYISGTLAITRMGWYKLIDLIPVPARGGRSIFWVSQARSDIFYGEF